MPLPLAALLMEIEMAEFTFHAHIADDRGCAIEAQERIRMVRERLRQQISKGLAEIIAVTERGCSCGSEYNQDDARGLLARFDEDFGETLVGVLDDLRDRAGGEE